MELIYIFIEKYRNFENAELSLSGKFDIKYDKDNGQIAIKRNENYQAIYPSYIRNINAIVGRNSVGKTNLIDLIGMKIEDRNKGGSEHKLIYRNKLISHLNIPDDIEGDVWYAKYFMIFYLGNNNGEDLFCIEGNRIEDVLGIFSSDIPDKNYFKSKSWFSFGCTYKNSKLNYMYDMSERLGEYRMEGLKILGDYRAERDKLAVISFRNNYKSQIYDNTSYKPEDDYLISVPRRIAKLQSNQWTKKVNMLIYLISHNNDIGVEGSMFADNKYQLVITYQEDVWRDDDIPYKKIYSDVNKNIRNKCKLIESFLSYLYQLQDSNTKESIATKLKEFNNYETIIYSNPFAYYQNIANSMIEIIVDENTHDRKSIIDEFTSRYNGFIKSLDNRYIQITNKDRQ